MLYDLPNELLKHILGYLKSDGQSVIQLSECSSRLYSLLMKSCPPPQIWEQLVQHRWVHRNNTGDDGVIADYRLEYKRRHGIDREAIRILRRISSDLRVALQSEGDGGDDMLAEGFPGVDKKWEHPSWEALMALRLETVDILTLQATMRPGVEGFVAARALQNMNFTECLSEWKILYGVDSTTAWNSRQYSILIERYALLVCRMQHTPLTLVKWEDKLQTITSQLDSIAQDCADRISSTDSAATIVSKIETITNVLANDYGFIGNTADYYNYRNSLLDFVLKYKKGIPITLCVLYVCICRRLDLDVHLVGLSGHVILGFKHNDKEPNFVDPFQGSKILTVDDCRQIWPSFGVSWDSGFLGPLPPVRHFPVLFAQIVPTKAPTAATMFDS